MSDILHTLYSGKVLEGDCNVYVGTAKQDLPTDLNTSADGSLTLTDYTLIDMKDAAVKPKFMQELVDVKVRESRGPIGKYIEAEGFALEFEASRADLAALAIAVNSAAVTQIAAGAGQVGQSVFKFGDGPINYVSLLIHMMNELSFYNLMHIPIAIALNDVEQERDRAKQIVTPFGFEAIADLTLPKGERMVKIYDMRAVPTA